MRWFLVEPRPTCRHFPDIELAPDINSALQNGNVAKPEKKSLIQNLEKLDLVKKIFPSDANFILIEVDNANSVYQELVKKKVIIRNRNSVIKNCLRITVGSPEENQKLIETLQNIDN